MRVGQYRTRRHSGRESGLPGWHLPSRRLQLRIGFYHRRRRLLGARRSAGYSPFQGGTNIFSFKDALDLFRCASMISECSVSIFSGNQMNVGTEAFQDGFWIIGNSGNFSGAFMGDPVSSTNWVISTSAAIPRLISCLA